MRPRFLALTVPFLALPTTTVASVLIDSFETGPATISFLSPVNGSVPVGEETEIGLRAEGGTTPGVYHAELTVTHNDPETIPFVIPIEIAVSDASPVAELPQAALPGAVRASRRDAEPVPPADVHRLRRAAGDLRAPLLVYDVAGRRVRTLVDEVRDAGRHQVTWNGRDDHGSRVAAGVYLYELRADGFSKVRRVTLIR